MAMLPRNMFDRVWIMEELNILHITEKPLVIFLPGTAADPRRWDAIASASLAKYQKLHHSRLTAYSCPQSVAATCGVCPV